jgi:hypothetical protein
MLFGLVRSQVTCVVTHERVCNFQTGVILCCSCSLGAKFHVFSLMNEYVIVYTGVILCCSWSLGAVVHVFLLMNECVIKITCNTLLISTNNIEWYLHRKLHTRSWVTTHVTWILTSTNNIEWLCCSCLLGAVLHVFLLKNECVIVYTGVILCCSGSLEANLHVEHEQRRMSPV